MREIKFRAWLKPKYQNLDMCYDVNITKSGQYVEINADGGEYVSNLPIMQFTGLKDKNGIDIYDGDILESNQLDASIQVNWEKNWGCWQCKDLSGTENFGLLSNNSLKNYSVIGNIYENPELLKNKVNI